MINFKEIPVANSGNGDQDSFEFFARDFFEALGYQIIENPSRGADGGRDLIIKEIRKGQSDKVTEVLWLVSCKHYVHSGKSITPSIETNIYDRIKSNNCDGFIGFYSTIPSAGLTKTLSKISTQIFDQKKIEKYIIGDKRFADIFLRYFPVSYKKWKLLNLTYNPIKLFIFYLNEKHEKDIPLLESIFLNIDNLFVAVLNSQNFEDFIGFKEIKLFNVDNLMSEMDKIFQKDTAKYKSLYDLGMIIPSVFLNHYLKKKKFPEEKLISTSWSKDTIYILGTSTLILNNAKMKELEALYTDLKNMI